MCTWFSDCGGCYKKGGPHLVTLPTTDRRLTVRYVVACLKLSYGTTHHVITNALGFNKVCARWVPRMLTPEKKQVRLATSRDNLSL